MTSRQSLPSLCALLTAAVLACPARAEDARPDNVALLFEHLDEGVQPGVAVMVIRDGTPVFSEGFGYADLERRIPLDERSAFRLGSVSKQFTAMAIMVLADAGKLDYDEPLIDYVPQLAKYPGVKIRHLLTHTAGLPDYYDHIDPSAGMPVNSDIPALYESLGGPEFTPGDRYEYSNPAYELLALIVERVSGQTFAEFLRERVFEPAGMDDSLVFDHTEPEIANRVYGYEPTADGFRLHDFNQLNHVVGAGGVYATLEDFIAWDRALYEDEIVSEKALHEAFKRHKLNNGDEIDYGFGWRVEDYRGYRRLRHGGTWVGFRAAIARYTDERLTIVLLSNRGDTETDPLIDAITDIYLSDRNKNQH